MRSIDHSFYASTTWRKVRKDYIKSKKGLCERCLAQGRYTPAVCVHHVEELNEGNVTNPSITYGYDNLMALCNDCHNEVHGRKIAKRYEVLPNGEVILKG
jgi:5-methylcytosine-specific restriction enzyme A